MRNFQCVAAIFAAIVLTACGDAGIYQVSQDKNGIAIVVNKYTGTTYIASGGALRELTKLKATPTDIETEPQTLDVGRISGQPIEVSARLRYADGKMLYQVTFKPPEDAPAKGKDADPLNLPKEKFDTIMAANRTTGTFTIFLMDSAGFAVTQIQATLNLAMRTVDNDGKTTTGYRFDGSEDIPYSKYRAIKTTAVSWNLRKTE